jgi:hypothetical protein
VDDVVMEIPYIRWKHSFFSGLRGNGIIRKTSAETNVRIFVPDKDLPPSPSLQITLEGDCASVFKAMELLTAAHKEYYATLRKEKEEMQKQHQLEKQEREKLEKQEKQDKAERAEKEKLDKQQHQQHKDAAAAAAVGGSVRALSPMVSASISYSSIAGHKTSSQSPTTVEPAAEQQPQVPVAAQGKREKEQQQQKEKFDKFDKSKEKDVRDVSSPSVDNKNKNFQ